MARLRQVMDAAFGVCEQLDDRSTDAAFDDRQQIALTVDLRVFGRAASELGYRPKHGYVADEYDEPLRQIGEASAEIARMGGSDASLYAAHIELAQAIAAMKAVTIA